MIHPTAIIGKNVEIGKNCEIGPGVIIEDGVKLGHDNTILAGAYLAKGTTLGNGNKIHMHAVIGHEPQDLAYKGAETYTEIGDNNTIREFSTIHRGTKEGSKTILGNDNYLMTYTHIAHNCILENKIIMVNNASLTGHCTVESGAFLSGMTGFHQFSKIGRLAMVSALSACNKDIPPYIICGGRPGVALGINVVGMRRAGFNQEERSEVKQAFKLLYKSRLNVSQALEAIEKSSPQAATQHLVDFIKSSKRGIIDGADSSEETLKSRKGN